jgi:hypothetical protein
MNNLFQKTSSYWVRYGGYEIVQADGGKKYVRAVPKSKPTVYDPLKDS